MRRRKWVCVWALAALTAACNESTGPGNGNGQPTISEIAVINSLSRTLQQFNRIDGQLVPFGSTIQLGANYDGVTADFIQDLWVTTTSAFGGSQIIFGAFSTGEQVVSTFPTGPTADAGRPTIVSDASGTLGVLVPARAEDAVYIAFPGTPEALLVLDNVGTFVERAAPAGDFIMSLDANLDDDGGTFQPNGPPRMVLHNFFTGEFFDAVSLVGSVGFTEGIVLVDQLAFLAGGSFDPVTFSPAGDGSLVEINVETRGVQDVTPIGGNGLSMEPGRNGLLYVVRTKGAGTFETDVLTFNLSIRDFVNGPGNPIQPLDSNGSNLSCRVVTGFLDSEMLCATFEASSQGRLVLLDATGAFLDEIPIGAGATDIMLR